MSHGASPSPWWTANAICLTAVRGAFAGEVAAASATSASVDTTATHRRKLPKLSTGLLCASSYALPADGCQGRRGHAWQKVHLRRRARARERERRGFDPRTTPHRNPDVS